jgi:hypothetical protein
VRTRGLQWDWVGKAVIEMTTRQIRVDIERLKVLVEVHGGDRERWPAAERLDMARLVAHDREATMVVAEAQALDRVLDLAPTLDEDRLGALTQRIVGAAQAEGRWRGDEPHREAVYSGGVVRNDRDGHADASDARAGRAGGHAQIGLGRFTLWPVMLSGPGLGPLASAAMLAVSLVIGILSGFSATPSDLGTTQQTVAYAGEDGEVQQEVMGEDSLDVILEDLL